MKRSDLKKLAMMGLLAGMACSCGVDNSRGASSSNYSDVAEADTMDEQELMAKLDDNGKRLYSSLSPEGKKLALQLANQSCKGKNTCAGLNSCATQEHSCMGKGTCKGTSKGPFTNKNDAVKVAAMHMAQKRQEMTR